MRWGKFLTVAMLSYAVTFTISCGSHDPGTGSPPQVAKSDEEKAVNFFTWSNCIAPKTIASFEKLTGIRVNISYFKTNEMLGARLS